MFMFFKNFFTTHFKTKNGLERNIPLMYVYNLFWKMQFSGPIEAIFFASITGSYTKAMSLYAITYMMGTILGLPLGVLSDRFGRKKIGILCALARLIAAVLYATAGSYSVLIIGSLFYGVYKALAGPNSDALIYESLQDLNRSYTYHQVISQCKSLSALGLSIGALLCGLFALISLRTVMIATAISVGIAFLTTLFLTEPIRPSSHKKNPLKHVGKALRYLFCNKRLFFFSLADASYYGLSEASFTFNSNFFKTIIPIWALGILRFAGHFSNSVTSYFSGKIGKLIGVEKTILGGALADNFLNIVSVATACWISPILKTMASGTYGIYSPASCAYLQSEVSADERVTLLSLSSLMNCGFYSICTLLVGWLADIYSPYWALLICYSLAFVSNSIYIVAFKQPKYTDASSI